jgi:CRISPR-associated endonuclease Csy4
MDHYIDVTIRRDPEFPASQLMNALYAKLHRALAATKADSLGVTFPKLTEQKLGDVIRLVGTQEGLSALMASKWLHGMRDHLQIAELRPIPAGTPHRRLQRVQVQTNPERLRRRLIKRHTISAEEARLRIPDSAADAPLKGPFLQLASGSTGQRFRLFLKLGPALERPEMGAFNAYGLSQTATVPWF